MFNKLDINTKDIYNKYLDSYNFKTNEYSFTSLYLWRNLFNTEYDIINNSFLIKKNRDKNHCYFMPPIGFEDSYFKNFIISLNKIKENHKMPWLFGDVEEDFLMLLTSLFGNKVIHIEQPDKADYIYRSTDLINLPGVKYKNKRNHYYQFAKNYNYSTKSIGNHNDLLECISLSKSWYKDNSNHSIDLKYELSGIENIILNNSHLNLNIFGVYVNSSLIGFSIGEKVSSHMAIIHIEKCLKAYKGIYAFINKEFIKNFYSDVKFINREEDLGLVGLRQAKMSYHPYKLEKKFLVNLNI